jgi:hypothetical protein
MDGTNCRSPIGGSFGIWDQSRESNRAVRMENVGATDVINTWLANGRNDFRTLKELVAGALQPGMTDREKATALWRLQTTHRFHATTGDAEVNDPVKAINVYGYTTCGDDSVCRAGLWRTAGFKVRPARVAGHCITQVHYDGRWHLLDGDMGPFYLLRDNVTITGEQDLVRDHDLVKRTHTHGILDADSRAAAEWSAALFVYESQAGGDRNNVRNTTMNLVLRPNEALVWRWGHRVPLRYHGRADIKVRMASRAAIRVPRVPAEAATKVRMRELAARPSAGTSQAPRQAAAQERPARYIYVVPGPGAGRSPPGDARRPSGASQTRQCERRCACRLRGGPAG